jgi:hypothetical protein
MTSPKTKAAIAFVYDRCLLPDGASLALFSVLDWPE